jgi:hypothetical protein
MRAKLVSSTDEIFCGVVPVFWEYGAADSFWNCVVIPCAGRKYIWRKVMRWKWKMFWMKLLTSKSWGDGTGLGRFLGSMAVFNMAWVFIMLYKIFYKNQPWNSNYLYSFFIFNSSFLTLFLLAAIHSVFKEKMHKEFWSLSKKSFRIWRINR